MLKPTKQISHTHTVHNHTINSFSLTKFSEGIFIFLTLKINLKKLIKQKKPLMINMKGLLKLTYNFLEM
jgi:hypothetical protein